MKIVFAVRKDELERNVIWFASESALTKEKQDGSSEQVLSENERDFLENILEKTGWDWCEIEDGADGISLEIEVSEEDDKEIVKIISSNKNFIQDEYYTKRVNS